MARRRSKIFASGRARHNQPLERTAATVYVTGGRTFAFAAAAAQLHHA